MAVVKKSSKVILPVLRGDNLEFLEKPDQNPMRSAFPNPVSTSRLHL